jgi:hypothetical protein
MRVLGHQALPQAVLPTGSPPTVSVIEVVPVISFTNCLRPPVC